MKTYTSRTYMRPGPTPKMPPGLKELMEGLTKEVLRNNPTDVYQFCTNHMHKLLEIRDGPFKTPRLLSLEEKIKIAQTKVKERAQERQQKENKKLKQIESTVKNNNSEIHHDVNIIKKDIDSVDKTKEADEISNNVPKKIEHMEENVQQNVIIENEIISENVTKSNVSEQNGNTNKDDAGLVMEDKKLQRDNTYVENIIAEKVATCIEDNIINTMIHQETDIEDNIIKTMINQETDIQEKSDKDFDNIEKLEEKYEIREIKNNVPGKTGNGIIVENNTAGSDIIEMISKEIIEGQKPVKECKNIVDNDVIQLVEKLNLVEGKEKLIEAAILPQYNSNTIKVNEESDQVEMANKKVNTGEEIKVENTDTEVKDIECPAAIHTSVVKSTLDSSANTAVKDSEKSKPSNQIVHDSAENTPQEILECEVKSNDIFLKKAESSSYIEVSKVNTNEDDTNVNMNNISLDHDTVKGNPHNNPKQEVPKVTVNGDSSEHTNKTSEVITNECDTNVKMNNTYLDYDTIKENPHKNYKQEVIAVIVNAHSSESPNKESNVSTNESDTNIDIDKKNLDHESVKDNPQNPKQEILEVNMNADFFETPERENKVNTSKDDTNLNVNNTSLDHETVKENPQNPKQEILEVKVNAEFLETLDKENKVDTNKDDTNVNVNSASLGHETVKENSQNPKPEIVEVKVNAEFLETPDKENKVDTNKDDTNVNVNSASLGHETVKENSQNPKPEIVEVKVNAEFLETPDKENKVDTNKDDTNVNVNSASLGHETVKENSQNPKPEILEVNVNAESSETSDKENKVGTSKDYTNVNVNSASLEHERKKENSHNNPKQEVFKVNVNEDFSKPTYRNDTYVNINSKSLDFETGKENPDNPKKEVLEVIVNRDLIPGEDSKEIIPSTQSKDIALGLLTKSNSNTIIDTKTSIMENIQTDVINPLMKHDKEIVYDTEGDVLNKSANDHDQLTENNKHLNYTHVNLGNPPQTVLSDVNEVEIEHKDSNLDTENIHRPKRDVSTEDYTTDASIGSNIESIENIGDTSEEIALNLDKSQTPMDLETAAVTIQKVFRTFLFKSRNSTIDDEGSNDIQFLSNDENLMDGEEKQSDSESLLTSNKERRALSRMDTVLQTVNEEKSLSLSTDDSSTLSSAATTIQAHVRGFLVRNKLYSNKTNSSSSLFTSGDPGTSSELENEVRSKTVLNIHIVPEGAQFESTDNMSVDLPFDVSPRISNLHPLGYDKSEPRKQLKREDAIQSVSPPSNNSGKLSEDRDSVKELPLNEVKILPDVENTTENEGRDTVDISVAKQTELSGDTTPTESLTAVTVIEVVKDLREDATSPEINIDEAKKGNRLARMSSDEMDVVTPYEDGSCEKLEGTKLMHSGEFHDAVLPTRVLRQEPSVVREFKSAFVYFLRWNN